MVSLTTKVFVVNIIAVFVFFSAVLPWSLSVPLSETEVLELWAEEFEYENKTEFEMNGWYRDVACENLTITVSSGRLSLHQPPSGGDAWVFFDIIKNVTEPIYSWQMETSVRWINGSGHHCIGVTMGDKENMHYLFLDGYMKRYGLNKGYIPIYVSPLVYQPTVGWHNITLKRSSSTFQAYYDQDLVVEYDTLDVKPVPITTILVGTGYASASEFEYVTLKTFVTENIPFLSNTLLHISVLFVLVLLLPVFVLDFRYRTQVGRKLYWLPIIVLMLYIGMFSSYALGEGVFKASTFQWIISVVLGVALSLFAATSTYQEDTNPT